MGKITNISWCDHSWNCWIGCSKVSPGCANCYAAQQDKLRKWTPEGWGGPRKRTSEANWKEPLKWNKYRMHDCQACGSSHSYKREVNDAVQCRCSEEPTICTPRRPRVFCASLADWLDDAVPIEWLADLLDLIRRTPNIDWLLLTKRPENFAPRLDALLSEMRGEMSPEWAHTKAFISIMRHGWAGVTYSAPEVGRENYWIGTTVENQDYAERRIPQLLAIPAKVRFLSVEPMLGPVDLRGVLRLEDAQTIGTHPRRPEKLHWVICGGESGPRRRKFSTAWARELADQCLLAGVPFFMKQDAHQRSGQQGNLSEELWSLKQFPRP